MNDSKVLLKTLAWRLAIALVFFVGAWILLVNAKGGFQSAGPTILGVALMAVAGIILGPTLAKLLAQPSGNLYYPAQRYDCPQPIFSIPQAHRVRGETQEAFDGFRAIAEEHPQLVKPYAEMIDIAMDDMNNRELAESVFHEALRVLKRKKDKDALLRISKVLQS